MYVILKVSMLLLGFGAVFITSPVSSPISCISSRNKKNAREIEMRRTHGAKIHDAQKISARVSKRSRGVMFVCLFYTWTLIPVESPGNNYAVDKGYIHHTSVLRKAARVFVCTTYAAGLGSVRGMRVPVADPHTPFSLL